MQKRQARYLSLPMMIILVGCVSDVANRYYASEHYPPKPLHSVELLYAEPVNAYTVIADFQSRGDTPEGLREKAAQIGADGIIVTGIGGSNNSNAEWAGTTGNKDYSHIVGTAFVYKVRTK